MSTRKLVTIPCFFALCVSLDTDADDDETIIDEALTHAYDAWEVGIDARRFGVSADDDSWYVMWDDSGSDQGPLTALVEGNFAYVSPLKATVDDDPDAGDDE